MRIAVVTPYHREKHEVLARCMDSVRNQAAEVGHFLVADGYSQDWVEEYPNVNHIVLRKNSGDFGDTPRSVGFLVAMRNEYDVIQFLDADNLLLPDHFTAVQECLSSTGPDVVIARRFLMRPDGTRLDAAFTEDIKLEHVDTSCLIFYRTAFHIGLKWSFIPKQLGFFDDRFFYEILKREAPRTTVMKEPTVGYACLWSIVYETLGEPLPPGCRRNLTPHLEEAKRWWRELDPEKKQLVERNMGISITLG